MKRGTTALSEAGDKDRSKRQRTFHIVDDHKHAYRVGGIPASYNVLNLQAALARALDLENEEELRVYSLASDLSADAGFGQSRTATISFHGRPAAWSSGEDHWSIKIPVDPCPGTTTLRDVFIDSHFHGFTPLSPVETDHLQTIDCIAIHGLGGHALGSFRDPQSCFVWLRDAVALSFPTLRVWVYGYDSNLHSGSHGGMHEYASDFRMLLRDLCIHDGATKPSNPIIFVAHSLGGLLLKQAFIDIHLGGDEEEIALIEATYAILFFGVPNDGMDTRALAKMAEHNPQKLTLEILNHRGGHIWRHTHHRDFCEAFHFPDSRLIRFYELLASPTIQEDLQSGKWARSGEPSLLVSPESATRGRPCDNNTRDMIPMQSDHMRMVKFSQGDRVGYPKVKGVLSDLVKRAVSVIQMRKAGPLLNGVSVASEVQKFFHVPFSRNEHFIGQEDTTQKIVNRLSVPDTHARVAIVGLGGIGKTQIALNCAYEVKHTMSVFWIHAGNETRFEQGYRDIATLAKLHKAMSPDPEAEAEADVLKLVTGWLKDEASGQWLLIIDNADDAAMFTSPYGSGNESPSNERHLRDYLPESPHGSIIFTSRDQSAVRGLVDDNELIVMDPMSNENAWNLIKAKLPAASFVKNDAAALAAELDNIPLAIVQATSYIKNEQVSVKAYLEHYRDGETARHDLLSAEYVDRRRDSSIPSSIIGTWKVSMELIKQQNLRAAQLLSLMSVLDRDEIPRWLITRPDDKPTTITTALGKLINFSLITVDISEVQQVEQTKFQMHRLVQLATLNWLTSQKTLSSCRQEALRRVSSAFPDVEASDWTKFDALLPHCDAVLAKPFDETADLLECASLRRRLAWCLWRRGFYRKATLAAEESYRVRKQLLGAQHLDTARSLSIWAKVMKYDGKVDGAVTRQAQALEILSKGLGPEHLETLNSKQDLGVAYSGTIHMQKAQDIHLQLKEPLDRVLGSEHPETLRNLANLSSTHQKLGQYEEAERLAMSVIEARRRVLGEEAYYTLYSMSLLCEIYVRQGKWELAKEVGEKAYEGRKKTLGQHHPLTLFSMTFLALAYCSLDMSKESLELAEEAVESLKTVLEETHPYTILAQDHLARIWFAQGQAEKAKDLLGKVIESSEKALGGDHLRTSDRRRRLEEWSSFV